MKRAVFAAQVVWLVASLSSAVVAETPQGLGGGGYDSPVMDALRARGPAALDELLAARDALTARVDDGKEETDAGLKLRNLERLIDAVGGQRYCTASRLFWYTDLEQAKAAAAASGKPILSLRMLGRLTDELSCANSRFFRTTLYANADISKLLRERFVLHWESVRPVPIVTIDFGDGRILRRTLTGNSAHWLLDASGRPLDALPGLYGPAAFEEWLTRGETLAQSVAQASGEAKAEVLLQYHASRRAEILAAWSNDLQAVRGDDAASTQPPRNRQAVSNNAPGAARTKGQAQAPPRADAAAAVAVPKREAEAPLIRAALSSLDVLVESTDEDVWQKIAARHAPRAKLDMASKALIRSQNPTATEAMRLTITKSVVEDPLLKVFREFESSIALDTVRNEYLLHRRIHEWFIAGEADQELAVLNERVYAELFLTPRTDPWLGLAPSGTYTAIENNGVARKE